MANVVLKNVVKNYGKVEVVHGINLDIAHKRPLHEAMAFG